MDNKKRKSYFIQTFGCQMNERDSEVLAGMLEKMGYQQTSELEQADLILFNTCCVREKAENKVLSYLGELKDLKSRNPELIIGVCGCMVQQKVWLKQSEDPPPMWNFYLGHIIFINYLI